MHLKFRDVNTISIKFVKLVARLCEFKISFVNLGEKLHAIIIVHFH